MLAYYRVTADTAPVYENDIAAGWRLQLRERQEWFAGLTGADMARPRNTGCGSGATWSPPSSRMTCSYGRPT